MFQGLCVIMTKKNLVLLHQAYLDKPCVTSVMQLYSSRILIYFLTQNTLFARVFYLRSDPVVVVFHITNSFFHIKSKCALVIFSRHTKTRS